MVGVRVEGSWRKRWTGISLEVLLGTGGHNSDPPELLN